MKTTPRTTVTAMIVLTVLLDAAFCANTAGIEDNDAWVDAVVATGSLVNSRRLSMVYVVCRWYIGRDTRCPVLETLAVPVAV